MRTTFLLIMILFFEFPTFSLQKVIDQIVAVVDNQVISMTDIKIVQEFQLYPRELKEEGEKEEKRILERLINQKLIIQLAKESISIQEDVLEEEIARIKRKIGKNAAQKKLLHFGLQWSDLKDYLREKMLYKKIINRKFGHAVTVNLEEIKDYYQNKYIPSQREKNLTLPPLTEVLDKIEASVREEKIKQQAEEWLMNLRKEAEIHIKMDKYKNIFNQN